MLLCVALSKQRLLRSLLCCCYLSPRQAVPYSHCGLSRHGTSAAWPSAVTLCIQPPCHGSPVAEQLYRCMHPVFEFLSRLCNKQPLFTCSQQHRLLQWSLWCLCPVWHVSVRARCCMEVLFVFAKRLQALPAVVVGVVGKGICTKCGAEGCCMLRSSFGAGAVHPDFPASRWLMEGKEKGQTVSQIISSTRGAQYLSHFV